MEEIGVNAQGQLVSPHFLMNSSPHRVLALPWFYPPPTHHLAYAAGFLSVVGQETILPRLFGHEQDLTAFPQPILHDFTDTSCPRLVPTM